jgi:hypothetical protein
MNPSVRVAGWAMTVYAIVFVTTFSVNAALSILGDAPRYPLAGEMQARGWEGILFMMLWASAGIALAVAAPSLAGVVWPAGGLAARISTTFGTIAAAGWMLTGCAGFAQRTALLNANIAAVGADAAAERAVVEGLFILVHLGTILFAFAAVPWISMVAVGAARGERMSRTVIGLLWIAGVTPLLAFLVTGYQYGIFGAVLGFGIAGILLLRRWRRERAVPERTAASATAA